VYLAAFGGLTHMVLTIRHTGGGGGGEEAIVEFGPLVKTTFACLCPLLIAALLWEEWARRICYGSIRGNLGK